MVLSLKALTILFDLSEENLSEFAFNSNWIYNTDDDYRIVSYNVENDQIDERLDFVLPDLTLLENLSSTLKKQFLIIGEISRVLPESIYIKFEKIINFEISTSKKMQSSGKTTQGLRNFSNSTQINAQVIENNNDSTVNKDRNDNHCKPVKIPQLSENKENAKSLQCVYSGTVNPSKKINHTLTSININKLDQNLEWIDIETTVNLTGYSRQTIQKKIKSGLFETKKYRKESGGLKNYIKVSSLPIEFQQKMKAQLITNETTENKTLGISVDFLKYPDEERKKALAKETIIKKYLEYRKNAKNQNRKLAEADNYFQRDLDQKNILISELRILGKYDINPVQLIDSRKNHLISVKTIKKWLKEYKESDYDIVVLCDNYSNSGKTRRWSDEIEVYISTLAVHPNEYTFRQIHNKAVSMFGAKSPSYRAIRHFVNKVIRSQHKSIQEKIKGKKAYKAITPYVARVNDAYPGDLWISDGYVIKFLVYSPYHMHHDRAKRQVLRPIIIYWLDTATELITGYAISYSERYDVVISSFDDAITKYGVPKGIMTDNAKSYHNVNTDPEKYASQKNDSLGKRTAQKLLNSGSRGFFQDLGVERVVWVTPGNPQAKKIEPYNHKIFDEFEREQYTYLGKTQEQRPERMNVTNAVLIKRDGDKIMSWEQFLGAIDYYINEWNNKKRSHLNNLGAHEYYTNFGLEFPFKQITPEERLMKLTAKTFLKVRGKQFELLGNLYQHPSLEAFIGAEIQVIYNVKNLYEVFIADKEGRILEGTAQVVTYGSQTNQDMTAEAIKARNYYEKQNKAFQSEMINQGSLKGKLSVNEIDKAYIKAMEVVSSDEQLRIEDKVKEIHKSSDASLLEIKSKRDIKPKKVKKPVNPRPLTSHLDKLALERAEKEMNQPDKEKTPEEEGKDILRKLNKLRGIPNKRR